MGQLDVVRAREKLLQAAIRVIATEINTEGWAYEADEAEYASDQLSLAARNLTHAVDGLDSGQKPVGW